VPFTLTKAYNKPAYISQDTGRTILHPFALVSSQLEITYSHPNQLEDSLALRCLLVLLPLLLMQTRFLGHQLQPTMPRPSQYFIICFCLVKRRSVCFNALEMVHGWGVQDHGTYVLTDFVRSSRTPQAVNSDVEILKRRWEEALAKCKEKMDKKDFETVEKYDSVDALLDDIDVWQTTSQREYASSFYSSSLVLLILTEGKLDACRYRYAATSNVIGFAIDNAYTTLLVM
jgi:hypothetical protein